MDAQTILETAAETTGWNTQSMLDMICEYVDNQGDNGCFQDFINEQVSMETSID